MLALTMFSVVACNIKKEEVVTSNLNRLTTPKVEKVTDKYNNQMSQTTYKSYTAFTKKFAKLAIETTNKEKEESLGVSIPDAYLCLAISAVISDDEARNDVLSYLELNSVDELRTSVKEVLATLCTLRKNYEGQLQGGYNLNSIWLDPQQVKLVEEKDEQMYKDLEEVFDASTYMEALTSKKANSYLDENGLKDLPTPKIQLDDENPPAMGVMSVYYCLDYFDEGMKNYYKNQYTSGTHKMDYIYGENTAKVDYIEQIRYGEVYVGDGFHGADLGISSLSMSYFLPDNKSVMPSAILSDVLDGEYAAKVGKCTDYKGNEEETTIHDIDISAPYFSLNNEISLNHEVLKTILPKITNRGAGARLAETIDPDGYTYLDFIKQFSVMKFNYDGFYSCSVTIGGYGANTSIGPTYEKYELKLDHPYIFQVQKGVSVNSMSYKLPIVIGEIVNPDYQD